MRVDLETRSRILKLARSGKSLTRICKMTGLNKTTVYYHTRKVLKGRVKPIKIDFNNEEGIGEFVGTFAGDGCFVKYNDSYHYRLTFYFSIKEKQYVDSLKSLFEKLFSKSPNLMLRKDNNVYIIHYHSKLLYQLLLRYLVWDGKKSATVRLKTIKHDKRFLIGFLRGLLDTDGYTAKNYRRVMFATISKDLAEQINRILPVFEVKPKLVCCIPKRKNRKLLYSVSVSGKDAITLIELLNPRNPFRIRNWCGRRDFQ